MDINIIVLLMSSVDGIRIAHRASGQIEWPTTMQEEVTSAKIQKVPIWIYHDISGNHVYRNGSYGNLTFEAVEQLMDRDEFELRFVNSQNVKELIPDIPEEFFRLYDRAKSDFLRASLLAHHGGIYMDADIFMKTSFHDLRKEFHKQQAGLMVYLDPTQKCNKEFTTNFMMGLKNNPVAVKWSQDITKELRSRCKYTSDRDAENGICCYNPNGSSRGECHIPWGSISRPTEKGVAGVACLDHDDGFSVDDLTGEMLWRPLVAEGSVANSNVGCWMRGPDMVCKDGKRMRNAMKRNGYHLYSQTNWKQRTYSRNDIMYPPNPTFASTLFRFVLLGNDPSDVPPSGKCFADNSLSSSVKTRLSFIHIPRAGGTAIEECTRDDPKEKWGVRNADLHGLYNFGKGSCYKQHVPPAFFRSHDNPYAGKDTFCIVRDPYERMISQFKFELTFYRQPTQCNAEELNTMLKKRLIGFKNGKPFAADCHYVPQSAYVFGMKTKSFDLDSMQLENPSCKHVLRFETIYEQANKLFEEYGYQYHLTREPSSMTFTGCDLTTADIDVESRHLIEEIYHNDFALFNYTKLGTSKSKLRVEVQEKGSMTSNLIVSTPTTSCLSIWSEKDRSEESKKMFQATKHICEAGHLRPLMDSSVHPDFLQNYRRFYDHSGWIEEAFVNYVGNIPPMDRSSNDFLAQSEELIKSVHMFSKKPILVFVFGDEEQHLPESWNAIRFPQLIVFTAKGLPKNEKIVRTNFNFNKMRAMILAKVRTGIQLDSDQFILMHTDYLFKRTKQEVTEQYPYPILPVHWMSKDDDPQYQPHPYDIYDFHCKECPKRTMRWVQAHPTWTSYALPFLGKWLFKALNDTHIFGQGFLEDEDIFNLGLWDAGVSQQWCKFDLTPSDVDHMFPSHGSAPEANQIPRFQDPKWYPQGISQAFITCHGAKDVAMTRNQLEKLKGYRDLAKEPFLLYEGKAYNEVEDVQVQTPTKLNCLI